MHKELQFIIGGLLLGLCVFGLSACDSQNDAFVLVDSDGVTTESESAEESFLTAEEIDSGEEIAVVEAETDTEERIYVFVCGQVQVPGVYELDAEARVCDAIDMAGGCLDTADICAVNQAERLTDGRMIYIPAIGEDITDTAEGVPVDDGLVDLNQADREELMMLPGIGEAKADLILEYRETHGGFSTKEELMNIPGIKEGVFEKVQEYITVK